MGLNRANLEMVQPVEGLVAPLALGPAAVGVQPGVPLQLVVSEQSEVLLNTEVITRAMNKCAIS